MLVLSTTLSTRAFLMEFYVVEMKTPLVSSSHACYGDSAYSASLLSVARAQRWPVMATESALHGLWSILEIFWHSSRSQLLEYCNFTI